MPDQLTELHADFIEALEEVSRLMACAYRQLGPVADDHVLAQAGLEHGREIVLDYLAHHEAGIAFEHLLYMIDEPPLAVSPPCRAALARIAARLGMPLGR